MLKPKTGFLCDSAKYPYKIKTPKDLGLSRFQSLPKNQAKEIQKNQVFEYLRRRRRRRTRRRSSRR